MRTGQALNARIKLAAGYPGPIPTNANAHDIAEASVTDKLAALGVDADKGLTSAKVNSRSMEHGYD